MSDPQVLKLKSDLDRITAERDLYLDILEHFETFFPDEYRKMHADWLRYTDMVEFELDVSSLMF